MHLATDQQGNEYVRIRLQEMHVIGSKPANNASHRLSKNSPNLDYDDVRNLTCCVVQTLQTAEEVI